MKLGTTTVRFQRGNIDGTGNYVGLLCDLREDFDSDSGEWILTGEGATGRGESLTVAAIMWIADRLQVTIPDPHQRPTEQGQQAGKAE